VKVGVHESTTAQLGALYPFVSSSPLPASRVLVGRDVYGGLFAHDPFDLYNAGVITNPNMVVLGQIGRGKSAFVKSYLYRQAVFGRRIVVLDPKGEYRPLAEMLGGSVVRLEPGGRSRLNPLDVGRGVVGSAPQRDLARERLSVLASIAGSCLGRLLRPVEHTALELALGQLGTSVTPLIGDVVESLLNPDPAQAATLGTSTEDLREDGREVALELRRLVHGELKGMFDGPTSADVELDRSCVVIDLAALYHSPAISAVLACTIGALNGVLRDPSRGQKFLVIDEAWAVLSEVAAARFFQSAFKLARAYGIANIAVVHRLSDLSAVGESGSITERLVEGLLADCETVVVYAQPESEVDALVSSLGLDREVARMIARLRRGVAYWRVGRQSFLVEHHLASAEQSLVDTDHALRAPQR
jgi:type IV secretory pathway VirB4 component